MSRARPDGRARRKLLQCWLTALCILGLSFSILLSPLANYSAQEGSRASGMALSVATWVFVLGAAVLAQRTWAFAALHAPRDKGPAGKRYRHSRIGLLTFAANPEGVAADVILAAGAVLWVLRAFGVLRAQGALRMLLYSLTMAGLLLHCLFNGKNFVYIKTIANQEKKRGVHS